MAPGVLTTLKHEVEFTAGTWTDVTPYVQAEAGATGTFGRPSEFEDCAPATWRFSLRNDDGRFMPDNPLSPHYPNVVENRRVRVTATKGASSWTRFVGFITSWSPAFPDADGNTGTVSVAAADVLAVLARTATENGYVEQANYIARYFLKWCDLFPFPSDAGSASEFRNVGTTVAGQTLGVASIVPAKSGAGAYAVEEADAGLELDGQLAFQPSGGVGPVLKVNPQTGPGQIDFFLKVPTDTAIASGGAALTVLDFWSATANLGSIRLYYDVGTLTTHLGYYSAAGAFVSPISTPTLYGITRMNDAVWRKVTIFDLTMKGLGSGIGVNFNDLAYVGLPTAPALTTVTRLVYGGSYGGPSKEGKQTLCPAISIAGIDAQGEDFGVFGYYALGQPPATSTNNRWRELLGYAMDQADWRMVDPATVTLGVASITSASPAFSTDDVGAGIMSSRFPLNTVVSAYVSPTQVTTSQPALSTTAAASPVLQGRVIGTDDRQVVRVNTRDTENLAAALQNLARTVGGVVWCHPDGRLELLLADQMRQPTVVASIDVEGDAEGDSIELSRSIESAPTRVTIESPIGKALLADAPSEALGYRREVTVSTGAASTADAIAIAGYYLNVSNSLRIEQLSVDLATAGTDLYAALIGGLRPGIRLRLTGLPSAVFGYTRTDVYVQGWEESYSKDAVRLTFDCTPADDPVEGIVEDAEYGRYAGDGTLLLGYDLTSSATSVVVVPGASGSPVLTTAPADYPLDLDLMGERVTVAAAPGASTRTNRCTNPSFETNVTGWSGSAAGYTTSTIATSTVRGLFGSRSMQVTWPTAAGGNSIAVFSLATTIGLRYSFSAWVYVPAGNPAVQIGEAFAAGTSFVYSRQASTGTTGAWVQLGVSFTATAATSFFAIGNVTASVAGQVCFVDGVLIEQVTTGVGSYFDGATNGGAWSGTAHASNSTQSAQTVTVTRGVLPTIAHAHVAGESVNVWHEAAFAF